MYRKKGREWTKHVDFMLLDILCIQLAFIAAYIFRFGISNPYMDKDYRILGIAFLFIDFAVEFGRMIKLQMLKDCVITDDIFQNQIY